MLSAFISAFRTPDLRKKLLFTLFMIALYRLGATMPSPGVSYGNVQKCLDAVNNSDHIMLFKEWTTPGEEATFMEEPGCSSSEPYARAFTAKVTIDKTSISVSGHGTFTAIRYPDAPK